jgi:hypothetical protein
MLVAVSTARTSGKRAPAAMRAFDKYLEKFSDGDEDI